MLDVSKISRFGLLGRALRWPLSLIPEGTVVPVLQGPLRGAKWVVGSTVHGCWLGVYEATKQGTFVRHLRPGDVVWDIGANVGFFALLAARRVAPGGRVHAFEPLPDNLRWLRRHLELNPELEVVVHDKAVGAEVGSARFQTPRARRWASSTTPGISRWRSRRSTRSSAPASRRQTC